MTTMPGKTCLVTGATGGIGKLTAIRLAALGATVIVARSTATARAAARLWTLSEELSGLDPDR